MKKLNLTIALGLALTGLFNLSSCNDEADIDTKSEAKKQLKADASGDRMDSVVVLSFDTYTSPNDVTVAADTSYIVVTDYYLKTIDKTLEKGMYVDIWHSADEAAFVVKITENGREQNYGLPGMLYKVERASFKDVLPEGAYNLSLDPYVDDSKGFRLADGRINSDAYFRSSDNTYHPVAYKFVSQNITDAPTEKYVALPYQNWSSPLVEANQSNGTIGGKFIDISTTASFSIPLGDNKGSIGIDKLKTDISASMWLTLDLGMKWFLTPYVKKFEAAAGGKLDLDVVASLQMKKDLKLWDKEAPMLSFGHYVATFSVLFIPVSIDCEPQLVLASKGTVTGSFKYQTEFTASVDLQAGVGYYDGKGWENLSHADIDHKFTNVKPLLYGQASANLGVYLKMPFMLYGCAGPHFQVGPEIRTLFNGTLDVKTGKIAGSGTLDLAVNGKIGASINVLGHEFAKWETSADLWTRNIWKDTYTIDAGDSEDAQEIIDDAEKDYEEHDKEYSLNYLQLPTHLISWNRSFTYIESLVANPAEVAKLLDGHTLEVGNLVELYCGPMSSHHLIVTAVTGLPAKWYQDYPNCKMYCFRPA